MIDPEILPFKKESSAIEQTAKALALAVKDDESMQVVADEVNRIAEVRKVIKAKFTKIKAPLKQAWQEAVDFEKEVDAPYGNAEQLLRDANLTFHRERERRAEEERLRLDNEARQKADDERLRLAAVHEETGNLEEAERILEDEHSIPAAPVPSTVPAKIGGMSFPKRWEAELFDIPAFIKGIADGIIPINMVVPAWTDLNAAAKALKKELKWPGVRAIEVISTARR